MGDIQTEYVNRFLNYNGPNVNNLWNNQLAAPYCLDGQAWSQGATYNCGSMGPDWFYIYDKNNNWNYGLIPCFGHMGETYGFCSSHIYFPGGTMTAFPPLKDYEYSYPNSWKLRFEFAGGYEFVVSCAFSSCMSTGSGAIQEFIYSVINDPFIWNYTN